MDRPSRRHLLTRGALALVGAWLPWRPNVVQAFSPLDTIVGPHGTWRWETTVAGCCATIHLVPVDAAARAWERKQRAKAAREHQAWIARQYPGPAVGRDSDFVRVVAARKRAEAACRRGAE